MPAPRYPFFIDGFLGFEREVSIVPEIEFPFSQNSDTPDVTTRLTKRTYEVDPALFVPRIATRTAGVPDIDATYNPNSQLKDASAYLIGETQPAIINSVRGRFTRTYARIPSDQVTRGREWITKPEFTPTAAFNPFDVASGLAVSEGNALLWTTFADLGAASYSTASGLYTVGDGAVYNPVKTTSNQVVGVASGGTFTLSYGADTTAPLAWNASAATILAAVHGLTGVIAASITFVLTENGLSAAGGGTLYFTVSGGTDVARQVPLLMDASSLTVNTSTNTSTGVLGTSIQQIMLATHVTSLAHGFSGSVAMAAVVVNGGTTLTFSYPVGNWGVIDADTVWVPNYGYGLYGFILLGTYSTTLVLDSASTYQGGARYPRTRHRWKFYLPGVSPGIATVDDIPVPADMQNPNVFLAALLTPLTGYQVYQVDGPKPWLGGPIYSVEITEVFFEDLV